MKAATISQLKSELKHKSNAEVLAMCLRLARFKKENKELLSYLLFYEGDESAFVEEVKSEITQQFQQINKSSYYFVKKSVRKILRNAKKHIRYSKEKSSEVEILLHFCQELRQMRPAISGNTVLTNIYNREKAAISKAIGSLHEDLQYDYTEVLESLD